MAIKVIIADDHPIVVKGYEGAFENIPNINVTGVAANGMEIIKLYNEHFPDITILDLSMPVLSGIDAAKEILKINSKAKLLFCSVCAQKNEIFRTYKIGGRGFISKEKTLPQFIEAIETIYNGKLFFDDFYTEEEYLKFSDVDEYSRLEGKALTEKEIEVLQFISQNFTNKEIAEKLFVSERTIEQRRRRMRAKLGLKGMKELVQYAFQFSEIK